MATDIISHGQERGSEKNAHVTKVRRLRIAVGPRGAAGGEGGPQVEGETAPEGVPYVGEGASLVLLAFLVSLALDGQVEAFREAGSFLEVASSLQRDRVSWRVWLYRLPGCMGGGSIPGGGIMPGGGRIPAPVLGRKGSAGERERDRAMAESGIPVEGRTAIDHVLSLSLQPGHVVGLHRVLVFAPRVVSLSH